MKYLDFVVLSVCSLLLVVYTDTFSRVFEAALDRAEYRMALRRKRREAREADRRRRKRQLPVSGEINEMLIKARSER